MDKYAGIPSLDLYKLTKNLTAQSTHNHCAVLPLQHYFGRYALGTANFFAQNIGLMRSRVESKAFSEYGAFSFIINGGESLFGNRYFNLFFLTRPKRKPFEAAKTVIGHRVFAMIL